LSFDTTGRMSDSAEQPGQLAIEAAPPLWRPVGVVFLAVSLGGLALGTMPELMLPEHRVEAMSAVPALPMLLAVQAAFIMLFRPVLARWYARPAQIVRFAAEHLVWLVVSIPLYVVAAWLSDASAWEAAGGAGYLTAVAAGAWGLGLWAGAAPPAAMTAVALLATMVALGGPVACYIVAEFRGWSAGLDGLLWAFPATCGWRLACRADTSAVAPVWAWALWPVVGLAAAVTRFLIVPARLRACGS